MSPERGIKNMLAQGMGNCFAISKSFRNLERSGSLHSPEFLMLEWYRKDATYENIMDDVEKLFSYLKPAVFNKKWPVFSLKKLFEEYLGINLEKAINDEKILFELATKKGYQTAGFTWTQIYDQLFISEIELKLPKYPLFLIDFPSRISPLCKPKKNNPDFAERFECYVNGIEIGNGNNENTNVTSVIKVFESQEKLTNLPIDEEFLSSLKMMNKNSYAGVGIGLDRLVMILNNETSINSNV
jgi:lysyl-tRNA synthetase class 2